MKVFLNDKVVKKIVVNPDILSLQAGDDLVLEWASFLTCLKLENLLEAFPVFEETALYQFYIETLHTKLEEQTLYDLFDQLFAYTLAKVQALKEVNAPFLVEAINQSEHKKNSKIASVLSFCEELFKYQTTEIMHDLTLYLGWDRFCLAIKSLFDYQSNNEHFQYNIRFLLRCLIESFIHIKTQNKTTPSFSRFIESLYFYFMREEIMSSHSEAEWKTLSSSISLFASKFKLPDFFEIESAVSLDSESFKVYTTDPKELIDKRLELALMMMKKIKQIDAAFKYRLSPAVIEVVSN